jgi:hypothetical protein
MPRTVMIFNNPTLKVATDQAGLATGQAVECQVTSARVTVTPTYVTIPATGCAGASQSPGLSGYALELAWLDDWTTPAPGGLSSFAWENDGLPVWFELTPDATDVSQKVTGNAYASAGGYGGVFGDGSAATSTATWPCIDKPTAPPPVAATATATDDTVDEAADATAAA